MLPLEILLQANANPQAHLDGETKVTRPYFDHVPSLVFGGGPLIQNTPVPLMIKGEPVIEFKPPEEGSSIARIDARITSADGKCLLTIDENEWIVRSGVWDYEWVGQRMSIRDSAGAVALQITVHPPKLIQVDRLRFRNDACDVLVTDAEMRINGTIIVGGVLSNCRVGLAIA